MMVVFTVTCREKGGACSEIGNKWKNYLESGQWKLCENTFWTMPTPYSQMSTVDPSLHSQLSKASLIIFKVTLCAAVFTDYNITQSVLLPPLYIVYNCILIYVSMRCVKSWILLVGTVCLCILYFC